MTAPIAPKSKNLRFFLTYPKKAQPASPLGFKRFRGVFLDSYYPIYIRSDSSAHIFETSFVQFNVCVFVTKQVTIYREGI